MSKYAKPALDELARTIRDAERDANHAGAERDRMLAKAHEWAQARSNDMTRAAHLREILAGADAEYYAATFGEPFDENAEPDRGELIADWRDLIAFIEATPELPLTDRGIYINEDRLRDATDPERRAEADRLAALMGVEAYEYTDYAGRPTLVVERPFGSVRLNAYLTLDKPQPTETEPSGQPTGEAAGDAAAADEAEPDAQAQLEDCRGCSGTGGVATTHDDDDGTCPECYGTGFAPAPDGTCGAKAVNPRGETGVCRMNAGHDDPQRPGFDPAFGDRHFDPAFGVWSGKGVWRTSHVEDPSGAEPGVCYGCGGDVTSPSCCPFPHLLAGSVAAAAGPELRPRCQTPGCMRRAGHDDPGRVDYETYGAAHFNAVRGEWHQAPAAGAR